jgi:hypothetical protein
MKQLLQQYLVEHHTLPLPGIGVLQAQHQPAIFDAAERSFQAPSVQLNFMPYQQGETSPMQHLVGFIAVKKNIAEEDAYALILQYADGATAQLKQYAKWDWPPLGTFEMLEESTINFSAYPIASGFSPLHAERVIRAGSSHEMVVGDTTTTNIEMGARLAETQEATDRWWLLPILLMLGAIALIVWHYAAS